MMLRIITTSHKSIFLLWLLIAAISSQSAGICSGIETNRSARADKLVTRVPVKPAPAQPSPLDQDVNSPVKDKWALVIGISKFQN
jgi:hypothetical protein